MHSYFDDSTLSNPPSLRKKLALVFLVLFGLFAVGVSAVFVFPRIPFVKTWRADHLAEGALRELSAGNFAEAQRLALASRQLRPRRQLPLRASLWLCARTGHSQALEIFSFMQESGVAELPDVIEFCRYALSVGNYRQFAGAIAYGERIAPESGRLRALKGRFLVLTGQFEEGLALLKAALESDELPADEFLEAARVYLPLATPDDRAVVTAKLFALSPEDSRWHAMALQTIVLEPRVPLFDRKSALRELEEISANSPLEVVRIGRLRLMIEPEKTAEILDDLERSASTPEAMHELGRLYLEIGKAGEVPDLVSTDLARKHRDLFLLRLDALAAVGRWADALSELRESQVPLPESVRNFLIGRCLLELGEEELANLAFQQALLSADKDPETQIYLAGGLWMLGRKTQAEALLQSMAKVPGTTRLAMLALLSLYRSEKDTHSLLATYRAMHYRWPRDNAVRNDFYYLSLLTGELGDDLFAKVEKTFITGPDDFPARVNYALALVDNQMETKALNLFENSPIELGMLLPYQRLVFAKVLWKNRLADAAREVLAGVRSADLLPEEEKLRREILEATWSPSP